jgi:hypothetical protein
MPMLAATHGHVQYRCHEHGAERATRAADSPRFLDGRGRDGMGSSDRRTNPPNAAGQAVVTASQIHAMRALSCHVTDRATDDDERAVSQ